ncbi:cytoskeletal protein Sojo isoform X3 [Astyanax mexicanus]|uniref:cytoskeletal protein Sojo isoform X3 n=1 Tax=Astyanax mexicanus TaxID=7994 RepID=UPI0020CB2147|nr:cytoskeletal protein Sojo isoform X3 [Astyanax mexicanus]
MEREGQGSIGSKQKLQVQALSSRELEMKYAQLRRRLSTMEQENNSLVLENKKLISELEDMQFELASSKTKVQVLGSTIESKTSSVTQMTEELSLEGEMDSLRQSHRVVDGKLKETQDTLAEKNKLLKQLKKDLKYLQAELDRQTSQSISTVRQRDKALLKAEQHAKALEEYRASMSEKIKKMIDSETALKCNLIECDNQRVEIERQLLLLQQEVDEKNRLVSELQKNCARIGALTTEADALHSWLQEALRKNTDLERQLSEKEQEAREVEDLRRESMDLVGERERERELEERNREVENCRAELDSLEAILSLLHLRDGSSHSGTDLNGGGGLLCAKPCFLPPGPAGSIPDLMPGTGKQYQQLLPVFQALEQDRTRQTEVNHKLQEHLDQVQEQKVSLQATLNQKEQNLRKLQTKLQESTAKVSQRNKELHVCLGQKETRIDELEKILSTALQEMQVSQWRAESLHTSLTQLKKEAEDNKMENLKAPKNLNAQSAQCAAQVKFLESALSSCQEELSNCQKHMEAAKDAYENQLESKNREVTQLEEQLEKEKTLASIELKKAECEALLDREHEQKHQSEASQLYNSTTQLQEDMNKYRGELSERERELLLIRRASGAKASQLAQMEKMLQETKGMLDKKSEMSTEKKSCGDSMVSELEEKVQRSKRDRRNSLHRTQLLESQMKTVRGELVNTLDHLQALRDKLHRSQQKAEERKAAMEKLTAELREARGELDHMRKEAENKHKAKKETNDKLQQTTHEDYTMELEQKLTCQQEELKTSARDVTENTKQVEYLTERLEVMKAQLEEKEKLEQDAADQTQQLQDVSAELQELQDHCERLTFQLQDSILFGKEKERELWRVEQEVEKLQESAAKEVSRLQDIISKLTEELHTLRNQQQIPAEYHLSEELQHSRAQLDQANQKSAALLDELSTREQLLQLTSEALLLKESEVTRLRTRLSSIERSRNLQDIAITQSSDPEYIHQNTSQPNSEETTVMVPGLNLSGDPLLLQSGNLENIPQSSQASHSPSYLSSTLNETFSKSF